MVATYQYCAAFFCSDCIGREPILLRYLPRPWGRKSLTEAIARTRASHGIPDGATDTDKVPEFAGDDGGGEADSPQACDTCGRFLRNPLTDDGRRYVSDAFAEYVETGRGDAETLDAWRSEYGVDPASDGYRCEMPRRCARAALDDADAFARMLETFGACGAGREFAHGLTLRECWQRLVSTERDYETAQAADWLDWFVDILGIDGADSLYDYRISFPTFPVAAIQEQ